MKKQPEITAATRRNLMDAFWELYKEKSIEKIAISEITARSGNNRSTFYHYFNDVYDLLEQLENEILEEINTEVQEALQQMNHTAANLHNLNIIYQISTPIIVKHGDRLFTLLGKYGNPKFAEKLRENFQKNLCQYSILPPDTEHLDYIMTFVFSAIIGLLTYWHSDGADLSEENFIRIAQTLVAKGVWGFCEGQP